MPLTTTAQRVQDAQTALGTAQTDVETARQAMSDARQTYTLKQQAFTAAQKELSDALTALATDQGVTGADAATVAAAVDHSTP